MKEMCTCTNLLLAVGAGLAFASATLADRSTAPTTSNLSPDLAARANAPVKGETPARPFQFEGGFPEGGIAGASNCCVPHPTPGCDDPACQALICGQDPFCCNNSWDGLCANAAIQQCAVCQGGVPNDNCPQRIILNLGSTPFSTIGATTDGPPHPECQDGFADPQVGSDTWYNFTAVNGGATTISLCGSGYDTKLAIYDGCECGDLLTSLLDCEDDTCGLQSEITVTLVAGQCIKIRIGGFNGATGNGTVTISQGPPTGCPQFPACPNPEHACDVTGGPGCSDEACCCLVCAADPFCCNNSWDGLCVQGAATLCGVIGPSDCCVSHPTPGCDDPKCEALICGQDPFCCNNSWDGLCAAAANAQCAVCQGGPGPCPNPKHDCFTVGGPGCDDVDCCEAVCAADPFCCENSWDGLCVQGAQALCGPPCPVECKDTEGEPCGTDTNGGCNSTPPVYGSLGPCPATVCGNMWAAGGTRDTDWYLFSVGAGGANVTWTVTSEVSAVAFLINGTCPAAVLAVGAGVCPVVATSFLAEGTYVAFAAPSVFDGFPCDSPGGNDYTGLLEGCGEPPCLGCCDQGDIDGDCDIDVDDLLILINNFGDKCE